MMNYGVSGLYGDKFLGWEFGADAGQGNGGATALVKTAHFVERQRSRGIQDDWIRWTIAYGERFYQGTMQVFFLGRKGLKKAQKVERCRLSDRESQMADGTVVVVGDGNALVTTYRNPNYIRHLKRCA